jgi:hypothetical protein
MTPLVIQQFAIEAMAIEIVDLPTKNCGFSINHPFIDGFSIANHPAIYSIGYLWGYSLT